MGDKKLNVLSNSFRHTKIKTPVPYGKPREEGTVTKVSDTE